MTPTFHWRAFENRQWLWQSIRLELPPHFAGILQKLPPSLAPSFPDFAKKSSPLSRIEPSPEVPPISPELRLTPKPMHPTPWIRPETTLPNCFERYCPLDEPERIVIAVSPEHFPLPPKPLLPPTDRNRKHNLLLPFSTIPLILQLPHGGTDPVWLRIMFWPTFPYCAEILPELAA